MQEISVVIPTYNRKEMLQDCLHSLFHQDFPKDKYEIIVVDDGSIDDTELCMRDLVKYPLVELKYFQQVNSGPGAARNLGFQNSCGKIIAFIDDDCTAPIHWLTTIFQTFSTNADIDACVGEVKVSFTDSHIERDQQNFFSNPLSPACPSSANLAIKKSIFLKTDGFDPHLRVNEDNDFFIRLLKKDFRIYVSNNMEISHKFKTKIIDIFYAHYHYGIEDPMVFRKNFGNRFVFRCMGSKFWNIKCPYPIYISLNPFNILFLSLILLLLFPTLPIVLLVSINFIYTCVKFRLLSLSYFIEICTTRAGRLTGNIMGSVKNNVMFYGP